MLRVTEERIGREGVEEKQGEEGERDTAFLVTRTNQQTLALIVVGAAAALLPSLELVLLWRRKACCVCVACVQVGILLTGILYQVLLVASSSGQVSLPPPNPQS